VAAQLDPNTSFFFRSRRPSTNVIPAQAGMTEVWGITVEENGRKGRPRKTGGPGR